MSTLPSDIIGFVKSSGVNAMCCNDDRSAWDQTLRCLAYVPVSYLHMMGIM